VQIFANPARNTFTEGDVPEFVFDGSVIISDPDSDIITQCRVTQDPVFDKDFEILSISTEYENEFNSNIVIAIDDHSILFHGEATTDDYETVLSQVLYENTDLDPVGGTRSFTVICTDDMNLESAPASTSLTVIPVNTPPTVDLSDPVRPQPIWEEGSDGTLIVTAEDPVSDVDSEFLDYCTFTIVDGRDGELESLEVETYSPTVLSVYDSTSYTLTLQGTASVNDMNNAIESLVYMSLSQDPTGPSRTIEGICVDTDGGESSPDYVEILISPVNTPPIVDLNGNLPGYSATPVLYTEDSGEISIIDVAPNEPIITDPDSDTMDNCRAMIESVTPGESLSVPDLECHVESSYDAETGILHLDGPASIEEYEDIFRSITYSNDAQFFDNPKEKNLQIVCVDEEGACSNSPLIPIELQNINDPPELLLDDTVDGNYQTVFTEGDEPVRITGDLSLTDIDSEQLSQCSASIADAPDGSNEILSASAPLGCNVDVESSNNGNDLLLRGPAPVAEFEHVLSTLSYENIDEDPTTGTRKIRVQCIDSEGGVSETMISLVDVIPLDDAPVVDLSGTTILGFNWEDTVSDDDEVTRVAHPQATIYDTDSDTLSYCEIRLPGPANPGEGFAFADELDRDISPDWVPGSGVLYLHGPASAADFDDMIRNLAYVRLANVPYDILNIEVQCVDEDQNPSNVAISTLHVNHIGRCGASSTSDDTDSLDLWIHLSDVELHSTTSSSSSSPFSYGSKFSTTSSSSTTTTTTSDDTDSTSSSSTTTTTTSDDTDSTSSSSTTTTTTTSTSTTTDDDDGRF